MHGTISMQELGCTTLEAWATGLEGNENFIFRLK